MTIHCYKITSPPLNKHRPNIVSVDCVWGDWINDECSITCGGKGERKKHRIKRHLEEYGGKPCNGTANMTETCDNGDCPSKHNVNHISKRMVYYKCISSMNESSITAVFSVPKQLLDDWTNNGSCIPTAIDKSCGPGIVRQIRTCINGTIDKCTVDNQQRNEACLEVNCERLIGNWKN